LPCVFKTQLNNKKQRERKTNNRYVKIKYVSEYDRRNVIEIHTYLVALVGL
jgi:hypothetical protein